MAGTVVLHDMAQRLECLFYHSHIPDDALQVMKKVRQEYVNLAMYLVKALPEGRSKSLALTYMEDSLMRAIQSMALTGEPECEKV